MFDDQVFLSHESNVRSYCRSFPALFERAKGSLIWDSTGKAYIDLFSGAGALNYGHNEEAIKRALIDYLEGDGIVHSLDLYSRAKRDFIESFSDTVLQPRQLSYKLQFTGPTGTNAVEAALKLARKVTGRSTIAAFTNGFHGMTLGALAATSNSDKRAGAGVPLPFVTRLPFEGFFGPSISSLECIARLLEDAGSGVDRPAAFLLETVQGEGGLAAASAEWLRALAELARRHGILLIVDDIQAGCGRTGTFFSFEDSGIAPDIVCLSKALSGFGLPLSLVLMKPELDVWQPGEHNGTFRGNNLAFVTARCALAHWKTPEFEALLQAKSALLRERLDGICRRYGPDGPEVRGRGLMMGLAWPDAKTAGRVSQAAFERGVLAETCGARDDALKLLPPLTIEPDVLTEALDRLDEAVADACTKPVAPELMAQTVASPSDGAGLPT